MARKRETVPQPPASLAERQQQIAQRAYELYVARGYQQGYDLDNWLDAEREVDAAA